MRNRRVIIFITKSDELGEGGLFLQDIISIQVKKKNIPWCGPGVSVFCALLYACVLFSLLRGAEEMGLRKAVKPEFGGGSRNFSCEEDYIYENIESELCFFTSQVVPTNKSFQLFLCILLLYLMKILLPYVIEGIVPQPDTL